MAGKCSSDGTALYFGSARTKLSVWLPLLAATGEDVSVQKWLMFAVHSLMGWIFRLVFRETNGFSMTTTS